VSNLVFIIYGYNFKYLANQPLGMLNFTGKWTWLWHQFEGLLSTVKPGEIRPVFIVNPPYTCFELSTPNHIFISSSLANSDLITNKKVNSDMLDSAISLNILNIWRNEIYYPDLLFLWGGTWMGRAACMLSWS
jgi:hypothetical protein